MHLTLEWGDKKAHTRLDITRHTITISTVKNRKAAEIDHMNSAVQPGKPYQLTVLRRAGWLGVLHNEQFLFRGAVPRPLGALGGIVAEAGWTVEASSVQRLEPVVFADDFMRTAENQLGAWTVTSGHWALQTAWDNAPHGALPRFANVKYAQDPFAWCGHADGKEGAICATGQPFWEDYTLTTAVRPDYDGAVGVLVNMTAPDSGILVRWSSLTDHDAARGNSLIISGSTMARRRNSRASAAVSCPISGTNAPSPLRWPEWR